MKSKYLRLLMLAVLSFTFNAVAQDVDQAT